MRILSDRIIGGYLKSLKKEDVISYQNILLSALEAYSKDESLIPQRIVTTTDLATHLIMPGLGSSFGVKILTGSTEGFKGITVILDPLNGVPLGLLNAKNLTLFRTALTSTLPLVKFFKKFEGNQCLSFGTGLQSYWHIRLTLLLYSDAISEVVIANRSELNLEKLKEELVLEFPNVQFRVVLTGDLELTAEEVDKSSVIFGCTPSTSPVIYSKWFTTKRRRFISLIGSYKPHMMEADSELVHEAINAAGNIIVDSVDHVAHEAGEIIQNNISKNQLLAIAEIKDDKIYDSNLLLCKIVGLSIMDTSIGGKILAMCDKDDIGIVVDEF